jgi:hypothetical protein
MLTETYELERIIADLYKLEETLGDTTTPTIINKDLIQTKVHDIAFSLNIWKVNNYDKLRESLNRYNAAQRKLDGIDY